MRFSCHNCLILFILSNIVSGCYSWYQRKIFENILNILGLLASEIID